MSGEASEPGGIAVIGASGQLGRQIPAAIRLDRAEIDLAQPDTIERTLDVTQPAGVVLAAAYTDVDGCETNREHALAVNGQGPRLVARWCARNDAWLLYISSNCVFDGCAGEPYPEDAAPNPISVYGASKLAGEIGVREETDRHFVIRTSWLFGPGGNNFAIKALSWARTQAVLHGVEDEIAAPTYSLDLAPVLLRLAATGRYGTYHLTNAGCCSRLEYIRATLRAAGIDKPVQAMRLADFERPSRPPAYSVLANNRAQQLGLALRPWQDALRDYVSSLVPA